MIPLLWRYLLLHYLRVFFLSVTSFIALLLVSRFKEIARFAALSCSGLKTLWFTSYQLPLILPIAIPISALIASMILFQRLSRTHELTALRASGLSLRAILTPLFFISALISFINFTMTSELAPYCRKESKNLLCTETTSNPLLLLQRQNLLNIKHAYLRMNVQEEGRFAKDFFFIGYQERGERLTLINARTLEVQKDSLLGKEVAILSYIPSEEPDAFDSLIVENQTLMSTAGPVLSAALKKHRFRIEPTFLNLRMLRQRFADSPKHAQKALAEIFRRSSLALAPFTFTTLGSIFAIDRGRTPSRKNLLIALLLAFFLFLSFFLGKELKVHPFLAGSAFFLPHLLLWSASYIQLRRLSR